MAAETNPGTFNGIYIQHMDPLIDGEASSMLDRHPNISGKPQPTRVGAGNELAISAHSIIESGVSVTASVADRPIILDLHDVTNPNVANIRSMIEAVTNEMQDDPQTAQMLLKSGDFSIQERLAWEKKLAEQIAKKVDKDPVLGQYREGASASAHFDDISLLSPSSDNVCRHMATVKAVIAQKVEDSVLPIWGKTATSYHAVGGTVSSHGTTLGGHVAVLSSLTGSVTEATLAKPPNYFTPASPGSEAFQRVVRGETAFISTQKEPDGKPAYILGGSVSDPNFAPVVGGTRDSGYQNYLDGLGKQQEQAQTPDDLPPKQQSSRSYRQHMPSQTSQKRGTKKQAPIQGPSKSNPALLLPHV